MNIFLEIGAKPPMNQLIGGASIIAKKKMLSISIVVLFSENINSPFYCDKKMTFC